MVVDALILPADGWSTLTEALPSSYTRAAGFSGRLAPGSGLLLATDGLAVPLTSPDVAATLGESWRHPPSLLNFISDMSFERRGEFDDRAAVGIWYLPSQDAQ